MPFIVFKAFGFAEIGLHPLGCYAKTIDLSLLGFHLLTV
jgi:hypothetical protein